MWKGNMRVSLIRRLGAIFVSIYNAVFPFKGSGAYWIERYKKGGHSGAGSYNELADFKAAVLNKFVLQNDITDVIEFGCGDGNQLSLMNYPDYIGVDISPTAIALCEKKFKGDMNKRFILLDNLKEESADLSLSLDVIYHLVEDVVFEAYMKRLFLSSRRFVVIYSSNSDKSPIGYSFSHVKHRRFSEWIERNEKNWVLIKHIPNKYPLSAANRNGSFADFFIYEKLEV